MVPRVEVFKFEGGRQLEENLKELAAAAGNSRSGKAAVRRAGVEALGPFVSTWQSLAPVLFGHLRTSIVAGTRLTRRQARLAGREGKSHVEVYAGTADPAGIMQEFGTAYHPAQPSGRPAWDQTKFKVLAQFGTLLGGHITKTAERLQRRLARRR